MRTFFIFKIKRELTILMKETPYNLYKTIEDLYYLDSLNTGVSFKIYQSLFDRIDVQYINKKIINLFKDNHFYNYYNNIHYIDNKYKPENSILKVYKSHIILKSNCIKPSFLINYLNTDNLFVCDFNNKDFFWLNEFVR